MRKQTFPNQPTDDVLEVIEKLVELKRQGKFEEANHEYSILASKEENDTHNYPFILKSWSKVLICSGDYDKAINIMEKAAKLFEENGNNTDYWQCSNQAAKVRNRYQDRNSFVNFVQAVSGGSLDYPKNFDSELILKNKNFVGSEITAIEEVLSTNDSTTLLKLCEKYSSFDHPFFKGLIGTQFYEKFNMIREGLKYLAYSARYGIKFPNNSWHASYVDGISQSLTQIFFNAKNIESENDVALKLFSLDYIYLSAVINLMPDTAHDSYELRARLMGKYNNFARTLVATHLSSFCIPDVLILSDHYYASQAYYVRNFESEAQSSYESAQRLHYQLEDISISGKDADQYELAEIAGIGRKRNNDLYKNMLPLGIAGKFNIEDKEYITFLKKLKFQSA